MHMRYLVIPERTFPKALNMQYVEYSLTSLTCMYATVLFDSQPCPMGQAERSSIRTAARVNRNSEMTR